MNYTFPSFAQWKQIFNVLKRGEKIALGVFFILAIGSLGFLATSFYLNNTKVVPGFGGIYTEGVVGQPRFINPLYGETDDVDRTLIDLVFSGLMTYDKQGTIVKDLADSYTVSSDGKTYTFNLKNNIYWHDGVKLTSDDVLFTISTIQNSDYKSPLRANWIDVNAQKISGTSLTLTLKQPYNSFLENCTLKIIPKHIWENISPENATLSSYNLQPVGSGPFKFTGLKQTSTGFVQTINLQSNRQYYNSSSFISQLSFIFFEKSDDAIAAANNHIVDGFSLPSSSKNTASIMQEINKDWLKNLSTGGSQKFDTYSFSLPRYFAVFLNNQKTSLFSDVNVRQAVTYAVNKNELINTISNETKTHITTIDSPILPDFYGYQTPASVDGFDVSQAKSLLDKSGFKDNGSGQLVKATTKKPAFQFKSYLKLGSSGQEVTQLQACLTKLPSAVSYTLNGGFATILKNEKNGVFGKSTENAVNEFQKEYLPKLPPTGEIGASTRQKLNELCIGSSTSTQTLTFTLTTINQPQLMEVANALKKSWQAIGITVDINAVSITDLKPIIKNRNYDALLYGETLGMEPDLYPFWHSSQKQDPGLNLSSYESKDVDALLKDARETQDQSVKDQDYQKIQTDIIKDAPAIFLYNPDYLYFVSNQVQNIDTVKIADPSKRFANITNWYIDTKRIWK